MPARIPAITAGADGTGAVVYRMRREIDAIDEYSRRLVGAIEETGRCVRYFPGGLPELLADPEGRSWVLLQYQPYAYGTWGFAPNLLRDLMRLRRRTSVPFAIMVHEAWVPVDGPKSAVIGAWQRLQLRSILRLADAVLASTEPLSRELGHHALHVPIASNITCAGTTPDAARAELSVGSDLVVATFGRNHPARALDVASAAINAIVIARGEQPTTILNVGADAPALHLASDIDVRTPGALSPRDLSLHLLASDMVLLPFIEGVSTRRTTLMAALAHGRPIIGTGGPATDAVLREHGDAITLTPAGDPVAFVRAAVALAIDPVRRVAAGDASRRLYEKEFDWPHVASRVTRALDAIVERPPPAAEVVAA